MRNSIPGTVAFLALLATSSITLPGAAEDANQKDYVVYFGLDVAVDERGTSCPVVSGNDVDVSILRNGQRVRVPVREAHLKTAMEPKLGRSQLTVEDVNDARVYSPRSDPTKDAFAQQMVMSTAQTQAQESATFAANQAEANASAIAQAAGAPYSQVTQEQVMAAQNAAAQASAHLESTYSTPMFNSALPGPPTKEGGDFDAYEISFRLSAPEALENAFGVLRLLVRDPLNARQPMQVVKFFPLRDGQPKARKVSILQTGLPVGFSVDSYSLHIYSNGTEVPTNLSKNRVELSRDEAHQFLILRHIQNHRGASLPPELLPELFQPELASLVAAQRRGMSVDLAINRDGRVTSVTKTPGDATPLTPGIEAALLEVFFLPALLNGNPVDGLGTFALAEFVP